MDVDRDMNCIPVHYDRSGQRGNAGIGSVSTSILLVSDGV